MVGYVKLNLSDVDYFCRDVNTFKSNVYALEESKIINLKSLLSILTLDLTKQLEIKIDSEDRNELDAFKELMRIYGGTINDES